MTAAASTGLELDDTQRGFWSGLALPVFPLAIYVTAFERQFTWPPGGPGRG